jgi:DNA-binding transcriptional ArsR family regulator
MPTRMTKVGHAALAKTLKLLLEGPVTAQKISEVTGVHLLTAQEWMRALRKEGVVHVGDWIADRLERDITPVYVLGPGPDKERRRLTTAQRQARYRERQSKLAHQKKLEEVVI